MGLSRTRASGERERTGFAGFLEVLDGPTGRRHWPDEVKARIVRESFEAGAGVGAVARRHGISPQQLTGWRRAAREGRLVLPWDEDGPAFVPVVVDEDAGAGSVSGGGDDAPPKVAQGAVIEIEVADIVLRLPNDTAPERIAAMVSALKGSA